MVSGKYATGTTVGHEKTLEEIRKALKRYNATKFAMFEDEDRVGIAFEMCSRRVRFILPMPDKTDNAFIQKVTNGYGKEGDFKSGAYKQSVNARWRGLLLVIKAKLESVEVGIETFDDAFMAQLVLANGQTVSEWAAPQIDAIYLSGKMPPLLPAGE